MLPEKPCKFKVGDCVRVRSKQSLSEEYGEFYRDKIVFGMTSDMTDMEGADAVVMGYTQSEYKGKRYWRISLKSDNRNHDYMFRVYSWREDTLELIDDEYII